MRYLDDIVLELADFIKEYCKEQSDDCIDCAFKTEVGCKLFNSTPDKWKLKSDYKDYVPFEEPEEILPYLGDKIKFKEVDNTLVTSTETEYKFGLYENDIITSFHGISIPYSFDTAFKKFILITNKGEQPFGKEVEQ